MRSLLVKLGAIGDCIMLLPAALALHQLAPDERLPWLCGNTVAPLLELYPWLQPIPADERTLFQAPAISRLRAAVALWPRLPPGPFDLIATLYYDPRYRLLTLPARARRRLTLSHDDRARRLIPGRHHTDEFARILLGWPDDVRPVPLAPVPPPTLPASPYPRTSPRPRTVLVPGGARNLLRDDALRRWPLSSYVALAQLLLDRGHEILLSGGPDDRWILPAFAGLPVTDLVGTLALTETLGLFADSDLVVTHDTGPLHLAGLAPTPLVAIFGPTDPRTRIPQRPGTVALWGGEGFACRPCYDGQNYAPCHHNACVEQITPGLALTEIERLLADSAAPPRVVTPQSTAGLQ